MLIDWFTVAAQAVNFLILVVLLKIFLYDKIVRAMDQREQAIQERLDTAHDKQDAADREREKLAEERRELEQQKDAELSQARDKAEQERKRLLKEARTEAEEERSKWEKSLHRDADSLVRSLRLAAADQIFKAASRVLEDVAGADLQDKMAEGFLQRIKSMETEDVSDLKDAARDAGKTVTVRSSTPLESSRRSSITQELHTLLGNDVEVTYEEDATLAPGVSVAAGSVSLDWSAEGYLDELEQRTRQALARMESSASENQPAASSKEPAAGDDADADMKSGQEA